MISPLPRTIESVVIQGAISSIPIVLNYNADSSVWTPITINTEETKQIILQPRDQITWLYSTSSGGNYFTFWNGTALAANIVTGSGQTLCWIKPSSTTVFEMLVGV